MTSSVGRRVLGALVAVALTAAAGLISWRVLRPAEVSYPLSAPYPAAPASPGPGVIARFLGASLVVDGRLRIYANSGSVRADTPADATTQRTPVWSYRRWPARLGGVAAVGPTVVTHWSDGRVVALDARTGTVAWRADAPPAPAWPGRRTGAATLWQPPGLHTSGATVLVTGDRTVALDAATGATRWTAPTPCPGGFTTAGGLLVCAGTARTAATGAPAAWPPGPATPLGCAAAASACAGARSATGEGWLTTAATPARTPALDPPGATAAGDVVVTPAPDGFTASAGWRWTGTATVLATQPGRVHLLTPDRHLVTLDAATGAVRSSFPYTFGRERPTWTPGAVYAADGYVAVERLAPDPDPDGPDAAYYFTSQTVLLAAT
ncbi:outer membrane protein assembly factor BamB family protein [Spirilliplanes yamanashiensis]|uniref:Pyrrolo-quinoline quinone repeat domain-containing protein n=1 Tax=Spirilliplanes yamanashiensis TaxID=42233 RepID=A0A8J4DHV8_9ACTN|nr:PQQ-binding-like beta-propeller repeat protein [Spirilliplanes yamanashiensis]MDP9814534.1 outer membrane protein assembly factor BamB [Spirilliplanes yamanashiensis]GIJ02186.1 hypothetical protein Sya03_15380 [Spirilliplanes yamanashiensis]